MSPRQKKKKKKKKKKLLATALSFFTKWIKKKKWVDVFYVKHSFYTDTTTHALKNKQTKKKKQPSYT